MIETSLGSIDPNDASDDKQQPSEKLHHLWLKFLPPVTAATVSNENGPQFPWDRTHGKEEQIVIATTSNSKWLTDEKHYDEPLPKE